MEIDKDSGFNPITPVPEGAQTGWEFAINGQKMKVYSLEATNPKVIKKVVYGWNGRYDQLAIEQLPGRMVVFICDHPVHGLLMGGADEPRILSNGEMFTPPGGFDLEMGNTELKNIQNLPEGDEKQKLLAEYGKKSAAREALEETGFDLVNIQKSGHGISNRAFFIADLKAPSETFNGDHSYIFVVSPSLISDNLTIDLPEDKMQDVAPAPEWSSIKKLQFMPVNGCYGSSDYLAVATYAKAKRWWDYNKHLLKTVSTD